MIKILSLLQILLAQTFQNKRQNIYFRVSSPHTLLVDSLIAIDTNSPDQSVSN